MPSPSTRPRSLLGSDVVGDPGVGGRGRRQHRDAVGQVAEQGADAPVVGPEVVAPVGDAVRLVDHQQATGRSQPGQHLVAEAGVVEPLGADQQDVDLAGVDRGVDRLPVLDVRRVDGDRADAGPLGGGDLVAHQRQQRRDDHGRPRALRAEQQRGHEVDRRLAPAGALHDQRAPAVDGQRLDRRPLVLAQPRVVAADQRTQVFFGLLAGRQALLGGRGHACMSNSRGRRCRHRPQGAIRPSPQARVGWCVGGRSRMVPSTEPQPWPRLPSQRGRRPISTEPEAHLNESGVPLPRRGGRRGRRRRTSGRGPSAARAGGGRPRRPPGRVRSRGSP